QLARDFLDDYIQVNIGSLDLAASHNIKQIVEVIPEEDKHHRLARHLEKIMDQRENKTIIFSATKRTADDITRHLRQEGWPAMAIHGGKTQSERDMVIRDFRTGKNPVMVATDVASRGLDVKDVKFVINYDFPGSVEDYVHRIGRTGRAGASGTAITFFTTENSRSSKDLQHILVDAKQEKWHATAAVVVGAGVVAEAVVAAVDVAVDSVVVDVAVAAMVDVAAVDMVIMVMDHPGLHHTVVEVAVVGVTETATRATAIAVTRARHLRMEMAEPGLVVSGLESSVEATPTPSPSGVANLQTNCEFAIPEIHSISLICSEELEFDDEDTLFVLVANTEFPEDVRSTVPAVYLQKYADVFDNELANKLPPHRQTDHAIVVQDGAQPPFGPLYRL
ncbi:ATP-dependent RNA helicase dbp2, partial [Coemansia sp. RSA 1878]